MGNQDWWQQLRNGTLKRETESLICAAQEQAIRSDLINGKIEKSQEQTKYRMCSRAELTTLYVNVPNLLRKSIKEDMIGLEDVFIGKIVERVESC